MAGSLYMPSPYYTPASEAFCNYDRKALREQSQSDISYSQNSPELERPMTIAEVARHYRMSERTVRRRIKDGTLQKELGQGRLVRISVEQLRKLSKCC